LAVLKLIDQATRAIPGMGSYRNYTQGTATILAGAEGSSESEVIDKRGFSRLRVIRICAEA
jgi:hypothetical protein